MTDHIRNDAPHADDRRESDRIRSMEFSRRLDQLERGQVDLREHVTRVTHGLEMVSHDQANFGKLMDARFAVMEKSQTLAEAKIDAIAKEMAGLRNDIVMMAGDAGKTPAGRLLEDKISNCDARIDDVVKDVSALIGYRDRLDGAFWMLWVGAPSGIAALLWMLGKHLAGK